MNERENNVGSSYKIFPAAVEVFLVLLVLSIIKLDLQLSMPGSN